MLPGLLGQPFAPDHLGSGVAPFHLSFFLIPRPFILHEGNFFQDPNLNLIAMNTFLPQLPIPFP